MIDLRMDRAIARRVDASDIVQDVLVEANRRLNDYLADPAMPFHLWLRHMARDRLIDAHRRHRVAERRSLDREQPLAAAGNLDRSTLELAAQLYDPSPTPAAEATWRELERRFQAAVEQLDDRDREVVLIPCLESPVGAVIIREPSIVAFLCRSFDTAWDAATPFAAVRRGVSLPDEIKQAIVRLLSEGMKDEMIARRLGMSLRTCRKHVAEIMDVYQASSRFQLAWKLREQSPGQA